MDLVTPRGPSSIFSRQGCIRGTSLRAAMYTGDDTLAPKVACK
jgi:hypothetical protein